MAMKNEENDDDYNESRLSICMISDFFFPNQGGVEQHIYQLSVDLIKLGHKVIVVTHAYSGRSGIRYLTGGLKVYYLPMLPVYNQTTYPTLFGFLPVLRDIFIRERIQIVHGHQAFSTLVHESLHHARTMGYKVVFTDHSLFNFADASGILMNKILQWTVSDIDHVICVSHTGKENTVLRGEINPHIVSVIPNAVNTDIFTPNEAGRSSDKITIVVVSRLVYRKGIDLLVDCIPEICSRHPNVQFIIGGDGPMRVDLEMMRDKHQLHDKIEFLGELNHLQVREALVRGHIFLNTSLTEAFCMAIVEAASCGLFVVSTHVGGVPEVLPSHIIKLAPPTPEDIILAMDDAIASVKSVVPREVHNQVKKFYNWSDVAKRTVKVYKSIITIPRLSFLDRLRRFYTCGAVAGKLFAGVAAFDYILWKFLCWFRPEEDIDICPDLPYWTR